MAASYRNAYSYDPDGNITELTRRNGAGLLIDSFLYTYQNAALNNKLDRVTDRISTSTAVGDLKHGQTVGNYTYDQLGNLSSDRQEQIKSIEWNAYGKMNELIKGSESEDTMLLSFQYDGTGQRVRKDYLSAMIGTEDFSRTSDIYIRDASGNILAVYKGRSLIGGGPYIDWLMDDVLTGTGGWTATSSSGFPRFVEVHYGGAVGIPLISKAMDINSSWIHSKIAAHPTRYYLEHSKPLLSTMIAVNPVYPVVERIRMEDSNLVPDLLAAGQQTGVQFMSSVLSQSQGNVLPVMSYFVATTPINANMLLQLYGQQPALMTDTQKVNFLMSQYFANSPKLINNYMQSLQSNPQSFYKAIFTDTAMVHAAYFAAYNGQNQTNETFFRNVFTAALNNNNAEPIPLKLANQYGGWIDAYAPGMLAQHAAPKDLASVIYNVAPSDFISDFGSTFGTSVFVGIMKDLPTFSVLGFHKKIKIYFGPGGITGSTYTPPDVSTPSPGSESLLADTLFLAEHHLYGSSRLGIVTYPEPQYRVVYGSTAAADTTLQVRYPWYSLEQDDWMKADKASVFTGSTYHTAVDTAGTLHHIGLKHYELSDHLGNVLVTLSDKRSGYGDISGNFTAWQPNVWTVSDYYPFGMQMEERRMENKEYRFGNGGQEKVNEVSGIGNHYTALFWEYDTRTAQRWNTDPVIKSWESPYAAFSRSPIWKIDPNGDADYYNQKGKYVGNDGNAGDGRIIVVTNNKIANDLSKGKATIEMISPKDQFELPPFDHRQEIKTIMSAVPKKADYEVGGRGLLDASRNVMHVRSQDGGSGDEGGGRRNINLSKVHADDKHKLSSLSGDEDYLRYTWHSHPESTLENLFIQEPSGWDIEDAAPDNFVISKEDKKVYYYNKDTKQEEVPNGTVEGQTKGSSGSFPIEKFYDVKEGER